MSRYSTPRPITADDVVADLDCGEPSLDDWLRRPALANQASGASRCFVTSRDDRVVGYYALGTGIVQRADASRRIARNMPEPIPVILLGRLAVDRKEQGHRLGCHLLRDAIARTVQVAEIIGVRALLVHALNDRARDFYLHNVRSCRPSQAAAAWEVHTFKITESMTWPCLLPERSVAMSSRSRQRWVVAALHGLSGDGTCTPIPCFAFVTVGG